MDRSCSGSFAVVHGTDPKKRRLSEVWGTWKRWGLCDGCTTRVGGPRLMLVGAMRSHSLDEASPRSLGCAPEPGEDGEECVEDGLVMEAETVEERGQKEKKVIAS